MERDKALGILKALADGIAVAEPAEEHQRSRWAIEARLVRLNKMPPPSGPAAREAAKAYAALQ
ncbi:MAG: hypothetical protein ACOZDY_13390 [Pseudomonadota bacterium]